MGGGVYDRGGGVLVLTSVFNFLALTGVTESNNGLFLLSLTRMPRRSDGRDSSKPKITIRIDRKFKIQIFTWTI